nr:hypothetical protein [Undibacterium umbellatum]
MNQTIAAGMQTLKKPFEGTSTAIVNSNDGNKIQLAETLHKGQNQSLEMIAKGAALADILSHLMLLIESQSQGVYWLAERTSDFSTTYAKGLKRSTLEKYMADAREASLILQRNLQRAADLVSSFKQIAVDHTTADMQEFSVAELITEISQTFSTPMRQQSIQLTCDIADHMHITSLPALLGQAVQNLLSNCMAHAFEGRDKGRQQHRNQHHRRRHRHTTSQPAPHLRPFFHQQTRRRQLWPEPVHRTQYRVRGFEWEDRGGKRHR